MACVVGGGSARQPTGGAGAGGQAAPPIPAVDPATIEPGPPLEVGDRVLFTLVAPEATSVAVAGTFNGWVPGRDQLQRYGDLWYGLIDVPSGRHKYKFVVDGVRWIVDPSVERRVGDDAGGWASPLVRF